MARNDSPDQEMERVLREHFASETSGLRAPDDLWRRLETRLGRQPNPSWLASLGEKLLPRPGRVWSPAFATAGVAVVAAVVTVSVLAGTGRFGGEQPPGELASVGTTEAVTPEPAFSAAAPTPAPAFAPADSEAPFIELDQGDKGDQGPLGAAEATFADVAAEPLAMEAAPEFAPAPTSAPLPTPAPALSEVWDPTAEPLAEADVYADAMMPGDMADSAMMEAAPGSAAAEASTAGRGRRGPVAEESPPAASPSATTFQDSGRLPFVSAAEDPVSTFSLDTDRTSYHLALHWARNGYMVEPRSVRAEEWVNAFDYHYAPPRGDREFAISSEVVRHPLDGGLHLARIAFQAPEVRDDAPVNVTLVLDASGSMAEGDRVAIAREAAEAIRSSLGPRDRIAVVHFTQEVLGELTVGHSHPDDALQLPGPSPGWRPTTPPTSRPGWTWECSWRTGPGGSGPRPTTTSS